MRLIRWGVAIIRLLALATVVTLWEGSGQPSLAATCASNAALEKVNQEANRIFPPGARVGLCFTHGLASGSHYRPAERMIYMDMDQVLSFLREKARARTEEGAKGTFMYVFLHELGHHMQTVQALSPAPDDISIELQADCFSGFMLGAMEQRGAVGRREMVAAQTVVGLIGD